MKPIDINELITTLTTHFSPVLCTSQPLQTCHWPPWSKTKPALVDRTRRNSGELLSSSFCKLNENPRCLQPTFGNGLHSALVQSQLNSGSRADKDTIQQFQSFLSRNWNELSTRKELRPLSGNQSLVLSTLRFLLELKSTETRFR